MIEVLEKEGVEKFVKSWNELLETVARTSRRPRKRSDQLGARSRTTGCEPTCGLRGDEHAFLDAVDTLVADRVASGIAGRDAHAVGQGRRVRGRQAAGVGRPGPGVASPRRRDHRAARLLADRGVTHVVLCGMGGSSLAPEVICATNGVELTVLDSSDPDYVRRALGDRLERTIVVVSSKSGGTVETDSQKRAFEQAFADADCSAPTTSSWSPTPALRSTSRRRTPATASSTPTPRWVAATRR